MRSIKTLAQVLLVAFALLLLAGRAVSVTVSHDENKFVTAGQVLADHGLLPYRDYPYDQMPYAAFFYAIPAKLSALDYLADRFLNALVWLGSLLVLAAIVRLLRPEARGPADRGARIAAWLTPLLLGAVFLFDPMSAYVLAAAKNNSFATLFALLGFLFFVRGVKGSTPPRRAAFWSGLFVTVAACTRLNYAVLFFVLAVMWLLFALPTGRAAWLKLPGWCAAGAFVGALPALVLAALAPAQFYYANIVQLRLTTLYYQTLLVRQGMSMASKLKMIATSFRQGPINIALYAILIAAGAIFVLAFARRRSSRDLIGLAAAACAAALLLTAFLATPMMDHYLFAPLPFLLIVAALAAWALLERSRWAYGGLMLVLVASLAVSSTLGDSLERVASLLRPASWPPLQVHEMAQGLLSEQRIPAGPILTLLPMVPAESGYQVYPFTASGSNSWRTSLLLTAGKRQLYDVVSPEELAAALEAAPPVAILTGFETPNPGFTFKDMGGLEQPFIDFARRHGYQPVELKPAFLEHALTLWLRP